MTNGQIKGMGCTTMINMFQLVILTLVAVCGDRRWVTGPCHVTCHVTCTCHYDLCPVDSCVNLLSALDSRNGVMSMRTSMAWNLFNNSKNRFCHRKTAFTTVKPVLNLKKWFYGGKTGFSTENLKTPRIQFQK